MAGENILIVEDDRDLVDTLTTVLESVGYRVTSATDGNSGWQKGKESPPDLAVVDIMMDTMAAGLELTQKFRADPELARVPIIMITAINQRLPLELGRNGDQSYLPVDAFIEKPVDPRALLREIEKRLGD